MYGRSEQVIGELLTELGLQDLVFLATKVWTHGKQAGIESMERSFARLQRKTIDLMQVHNLVDVATQLATMRDWKAQGRFRYLGITNYNASAFAEVANILAREQLDFLQINYSIMEPEAKKKFYRWHRDVASPCSSIGHLAEAICYSVFAESRCPLSPLNSNPTPGRNFS